MNDTIVAISSALSPGLRGIIRISGENAFEVVASYCRKKLPEKSSRILCELAISGWGTFVESVLYLMKAPHSYTCDDTVEIHTFSSPVLLQKLAGDFISQGARLAHPGEFTKRAFMAGRIDLAQAESVQALIMASDEAERRAAMLGISGHLSQNLQQASDEVSKALALLETYIDFIEEDIGTLPEQRIIQGLESALTKLEKLSHNGISRLEGVCVCICGLPNAGKSSLFNLLQHKVALTSQVAGTTLDWLEGEAVLAGITFKFIDTAGMLDNPTGIWLKSQQQLTSLAKGADFIIYLISGAEPFSDSHIRLVKEFSVPMLFVKSKSDIPSLWPLDLIKQKWKGADSVEISIYEENSLASVREWLIKQVNPLVREPTLLSVRQQSIAREAMASIARTLKGIAAGVSYEFPAVDLRDTLALLGEMVGKTTSDDILDQIFSQFCIGK